MHRLVRLPFAGVAAGALALVPASPAAARPAARAACGYRATMSAPNHNPRAGDRHWVVRVSVRPRNLVTAMKYQFVFSGRVVATRYVGGNRRFRFRGRMADSVLWPKRAIGIPLILRVVLHNRCGTKRLNWKVKVRR